MPYSQQDNSLPEDGLEGTDELKRATKVLESVSAILDD